MSSSPFSMALVPRDGFFFKDGRGWYTSNTNRAVTLSWPFPSTVRGALTTACGYFEQERKERLLVEDEWSELRDRVTVSGLLPLRRGRLETAWTASHRLWPVPRDAVHLRDEVVALEPRPPRTGIQSLAMEIGGESEALEAMWHPHRAGGSSQSDKPVEAPEWWDNATFVKWLSAREYDTRVVRNPKTLRMESRPDVKVVIEAGGLTARDGGLFSYEVLEALTATHQWAVGVRGEVPSTHLSFVDHPMTLGGKGRLMHLEPFAETLWDFPDELQNAFARGARGLRLVMVTPGCFQEGWRLPGFRPEGRHFVGRLAPIDGELVLRAAILPRALHVSGWDRGKNRAKATRRLVAPGSVYFLHKRNGGLFQAAEARELWLAALGDDLEDGLGRVVPGTWRPDDATFDAP